MTTPEIGLAREVLQTEADAILNLKAQLGASFEEVLETIAALAGKVIITGVGKSGIVGMKIASTMASTGTPALFMHPVEGIHGDLGILSAGDLLLAISNSGETEEVLNLIHAARQLGVPTACICRSPDSTLAGLCDHVLVVAVDREACPLGLAPTASTTAVLAMGDALAMTLSARRKFTAENYAAFHPGGTLGQRLKLKVKDLMRTGENIPIAREDQSLMNAFEIMTRIDNLGVTLVVDMAGHLTGILTDGDIRRIILGAEKGLPSLTAPVQNYMTPHPKVIECDASASEALQTMEAASITSLAIIDANSQPAGIIHLHDILGRGKVII